MLFTCTSKTLRLCAAGRCNRTLIPGNASQSLVVEDRPLSLLCRFGSNPVAEQSLTVEDGPLSPPAERQQLGTVLVTCTSKTFRLCAAGRY